jgi:hypothetical protein
MMRNGETTPPVKSRTRGLPLARLERVLWWTPMTITPLSSVNRGQPRWEEESKIKREKGGDEGVYRESLENMMEVRNDIGMQRRDLEERREA